MYIKLIQPRMCKRPMDTDIKTHMAPPLGLLTVANLLRNKHRVVLENENVQPIGDYDKPDIVGISVTVDVLPRAMEISRRFREQGSIVVAGGIHITTASETIPDNVFDVLCIGAAEGTWPDIIRDFQSGTLQKEYRCPADFPANRLISPAYDMLDPALYLYCNVVHTSRGSSAGSHKSSQNTPDERHAKPDAHRCIRFGFYSFVIAILITPSSRFSKTR